MSQRVVTSAGLLAALVGALVLAGAAAAALASETVVPAGEGDATTTTILAEGPTEPTTGPGDDGEGSTTTVIGPDSPELPATGGGHAAAFTVTGLALMVVGAGAVAVAVRRIDRLRGSPHRG